MTMRWQQLKQRMWRVSAGWRRMRRRTSASPRGVTLVELLVAMAVLSFGILPLVSIFIYALRVSERSNKMTMALNLARDMSEEIRANAFWDPDVANNPDERVKYYPLKEIAPTPQPFGLETGEGYVGDDDGSKKKGRLASFDDVDDYNGWCRGPKCADCAALAGDLCKVTEYEVNYRGEKYDGTGGHPMYRNFTRRVRVFNIFQNTTAAKANPHQIRFGAFSTKTFNFFDLRDGYDARSGYKVTDDIMKNLTTNGKLRNQHAKGMTRLKVIEVSVEYTGQVAGTVGVKDVSFAVMPITEK